MHSFCKLNNNTTVKYDDAAQLVHSKKHVFALLLHTLYFHISLLHHSDTITVESKVALLIT